MSPLEFMQLSIEWPVCGGQIRRFYVCRGSGHAGRLPRFVAEKRPLKLCFPEAADRH
jgi:hypothetical protein